MGEKVGLLEQAPKLTPEVPLQGEFDALLHEGILITGLILATADQPLRKFEIVNKWNEIQDGRGWIQTKSTIYNYIDDLINAGLMQKANGAEDSYIFADNKKLDFTAFALSMLSTPLIREDGEILTYKGVFGQNPSEVVKDLRYLINLVKAWQYQGNTVENFSVTVLELVEMTGLGKERLRNTIKKLQTLGFIKHESKKVRKNFFEITLPYGLEPLLTFVSAADIKAKDVTTSLLQEWAGALLSSEQRKSWTLTTLAKAYLADSEMISQVTTLMEKSSSHNLHLKEEPQKNARLILDVLIDETPRTAQSIVDEIKPTNAKITRGGVLKNLEYLSEKGIVTNSAKNTQRKTVTVTWEINQDFVEKMHGQIQNRLQELLAAQSGLSVEEILEKLKEEELVESILLPIARKVVEELRTEYLKNSPEGIWRKAVRKMLRGEEGQFVIVYHKKWPQESRESGQVEMAVADNARGVIGKLAGLSKDDEPFLPELYRNAIGEESGIKMAYTNLRGPDNKEIPGKPNFLMIEVIDTSKVRRNQSTLGLDILSADSTQGTKYMRYKGLVSVLGTSRLAEIIKEEKARLSEPEVVTTRR